MNGDERSREEPRRRDAAAPEARAEPRIHPNEESGGDADPRGRDKEHAIRAIYAAVGAPDWAAPNLDALIDILRDLSWLPPGPVVLRFAGTVPDVVADALRIVAAETADTDRPVTVGRYRPEADT